MKKPINLLLAVQTILLIVTASLMLSGCIIVHPDDEDDIYIGKTSRVKTAESSEEDDTETAEQTAVTGQFSITCKNQTSTKIVEWCVKCDRNVTLPNTGFTRSIKENGGEDKISDLPQGYYRIYFVFENGQRGEDSITLDKDVTYCIIGSTDSYTVECRAAK